MAMRAREQAGTQITFELSRQHNLDVTWVPTWSRPLVARASGVGMTVVGVCTV